MILKWRKTAPYKRKAKGFARMRGGCHDRQCAFEKASGSEKSV